jgi:hypothetical protein
MRLADRPCLAYDSYVKQGTYSEQVRAYALVRYIAPARNRREPDVRIVAGEIHRALGFVNRYPLVCDALISRRFLAENRLTLLRREGPPSGQGARVVLTYRFLDPPAPAPQPSAELPLSAYRGIARAVFQTLGGGENFMRGRRESLYEPENAPGDAS